MLECLGLADADVAGAEMGGDGCGCVGEDFRGTRAWFIAPVSVRKWPSIAR